MARPETVTLCLAAKDGALVVQVKSKTKGIVGEVVLKGMTSGEFELETQASAIITKAATKHDEPPAKQEKKAPPSPSGSVGPIDVDGSVLIETESGSPADDFRPPIQEGESRSKRTIKRSDK